MEVSHMANSCHMVGNRASERESKETKAVSERKRQKRKKQEIQGHLHLHPKFQVSLIIQDPVSKTKTKQDTILKRDGDNLTESGFVGDPEAGEAKWTCCCGEFQVSAASLLAD